MDFDQYFGGEDGRLGVVEFVGDSVEGFGGEG